jgi:hypothetical protein
MASLGMQKAWAWALAWACDDRDSYHALSCTVYTTGRTVVDGHRKQGTAAGRRGVRDTVGVGIGAVMTCSPRERDADARRDEEAGGLLQRVVMVTAEVHFKAVEFSPKPKENMQVAVNSDAYEGHTATARTCAVSRTVLGILYYVYCIMYTVLYTVYCILYTVCS